MKLRLAKASQLSWSWGLAWLSLAICIYVYAPVSPFILQDLAQGKMFTQGRTCGSSEHPQFIFFSLLSVLYFLILENTNNFGKTFICNWSELPCKITIWESRNWGMFESLLRPKQYLMYLSCLALVLSIAYGTLLWDYGRTQQSDSAYSSKKRDIHWKNL